MSETTSALINAMVNSNAIDTENSFGAAMAEKLSGKLDAMRQDIAQNMFKSQEEVVDEEPVVEVEPTEETTE
jgi:hypothetical protein